MTDRRDSVRNTQAQGRRPSLQHFQQFQENIKEKQQKFKDERESRSSRITPPIRDMIDYVADYCNLDKLSVTGFVIDSEEQVELLEQFLNKGGTRAIMFYYQDGEVPKLESGRAFPKNDTGIVKKIIVTTGKEVPLKGKAVYFIKAKAELKITGRNFADEINFGILDPETDGSVLLSLSNLLGKVFLPALKCYEQWGKLQTTEEGNQQRMTFIANFENTINYLESAHKHTQSVVHLAPGPEEDLLEAITRPDKQKEVAQKPELVKVIEDLVGDKWCKQMEQVLAESEQMRKEADDTGPIAELEHWRNLSAKFNFILEQIKSARCKNSIQTLGFAKSKILKPWFEFEGRITDYANEAKDNVKFLNSLEQVCMPLYCPNPSAMTECIPNLINVVTNIHSISRYYNTSQRMTSLYIKVTNQVVASCKNYLTKNGSLSIWEQESDDILNKITEVDELFHCYVNHFQQTKQKLQVVSESNGNGEFECSEMYIFGKLESFCKRLQKITGLIRTIKVYSVLTESKIEGIEAIANKFTTIVQTTKKKPYDILDPRKTDFDRDFNVFRESIDQVEQSIVNFMDECFEKIHSSDLAVMLIKRFQQLNLPFLQPFLEEKYERVIFHYWKEIDHVQRLYLKQKENPPLPKNTPDLTGRLCWIRQLLRKLQIPIFTLNEEVPDILKSKVGIEVVKKYNKLALILVEYEEIYIKKWENAVEEVQFGLHATLLVRQQSTQRLFVNWDHKISEIAREVKIIERLGLNTPKLAIDVNRKIIYLKDTRQKLTTIISKYENLRLAIPQIFNDIIQPYVAKVNTCLREGVLYVLWSSLNHQVFFDKVTGSLSSLELVLKKVTDIKEARIDHELKNMAEELLVDLPDEATDISHFIDHTKSVANNAGLHLAKSSEKIRAAVLELIKYFAKESDMMDRLNSVDRQMDDDCEAFRVMVDEIFNYFREKQRDALSRCIRFNLDTLRKRVFYRGNKTNERTHGAMNSPLFLANINLVIPNVVIEPSLDEIQTTMNQVCMDLVSVSKQVTRWQKPTWAEIRSPNPSAVSMSGWNVSENVEENKDDAESYYKLVSENKEIAKLVMMVSSAVNSVRDPIATHLQQFNAFHELWIGDREVVVNEFKQTEPLLTDWKARVTKYDQLSDEIGELPSRESIGPIDLAAQNVKSSLQVEARLWKVSLCKSLNQEYKAKMVKLEEFIEENSKALSRPVKDLEDIRYVMDSLTQVREHTLDVEHKLGPIEEAYAMLHKFDIQVDAEEANQVDTLRYNWKKIQSKEKGKQEELIKLQEPFHHDLVHKITEFQDSVAEFTDSYETEGPMVEGIPPAEASDRLAFYQRKFDDLWRKYTTYSSGEQLFGLCVTDYPDLHQIKRDLGLLQKLYSLYNLVKDSFNGYYEILWSDVDIEQISSELIEFQNKCRKLPKALKEWPAFLDLSKSIDELNQCCPILELMSSKAMKQRHWTRIEQTTGVFFDVENENFCLKNIMDAPILENGEDIEDICISAVKEKDIEAKLIQLVADWSGYELYFSNFKTRGELLLRGAETTETISIMEDSLMILSSLLSNRYNAPFKPDIQIWVHKLSNTTDIIEQWLIVQNLWIYLEAVFVGGDIAKQLPQEAKRFANIDKTWVKIMSRAHDNPNVVQCCVGDETMPQLLPHLLEQLEQCQKSLTGYLEQKRLVFPRFFFISDPALLEILGQASDSHTITAHLLGIFENVADVQFHPKEYNKIESYSSREGETVILDTPVIAEGNVELWLGLLLKNQQAALHGVIRNAFYAVCDQSNFNMLGFLHSEPAQVGLLGIQMLWTYCAEEALKAARSDKKIMNSTNLKFQIMLQTLIDQTATDLTKFDRIKFETLVTIHVHQRDIFDDLTRMHIKTPQDFEWLKQARFYFDVDEDHCIVSITDVNFIYQNEFLGCTERLVITPLTDRCYITLAQALGMSMGGAPAGPAGTGKTETTKDMAKALGKYCVVFNCSDQMDFRGLGRIYKGLAQSGSWGCFDEFNRIDLPVLSVAAQQIQIVLNARKEKKTSFIFSDGDNVSLNPEFGLFITMNPGYAGRQELPENLKVQFRSVAMMVPDRQIIKRVKLAACGFQENQILAAKFYTLYKLCEEQLTKQVHYDFGLRNILSCLRTLGAVKRARPEDTESSIVMRVLRDMNLSKLVDEDEPLFMSLIGDLFPGIVLDIVNYEDLQAAMSLHIAKNQLINYPAWNLKVVQLFETQNVRHGIMSLGPSGAGKTCCIRTLMRALTEMGSPHREVRMNPKAITAPQMFGRLDVSTNDWTDGIFSTLWRRTRKTKKGENVWLILDGPVDAIWIENLNSVLDDNKTLTLANGDRIPMAPNCKILFEVHNIDNASPATVSRNGMIFMSSSVLDWKPLIDGWLLHRKPQEQEMIGNLIGQMFIQCYNYVEHELNPKMVLLQCIYVRQMCDVLDGLLSTENQDVQKETHINKLVVFAIMWSIGATLELDERFKLEHFIREQNATRDDKLILPDVKESETMFEYMVDPVTGAWQHWSTLVHPFEYPLSGPVPVYSNILIPNVDNVRTNFLIDIISKQGKGVLLIGEQGTAKTVMINGYLHHHDPDEHVIKSLNFSSATEPVLFQHAIESYVDKRMGSTYGPPAGRKMTVFIDDINMPIINNWGDQITNEIVRQMMEYKGMYSLEKPGDFTTIVDVQFVAAMIHPGGGRNDIPERLKRGFNVFNCTLPSNASIDKIFGTLSRYFSVERGFASDIVQVVPKLVSTSRILWQATKVKMLPTPAKFHYIFNLRDLSRVWEGMLHIEPEECKNVETVIALWTHEIQRVISDRFTNENDTDWFNAALRQSISDHISPDIAKSLDMEPIFVDFLRDAPEPTGEEDEDACFDAPKIYERVNGGIEQLRERLYQYMEMFNENVRGSAMDLVFFKDAITHLCKISRIIRTPRGAAMLVGVGGSGKQSLTTLASFIAGYKVFQITLTRTYNVQNLMDDLKYLYRQAGQVGQGMTFIFTDNDIKDENFLEYLNNLLSSGEISGLFPHDEIDEITGELIPVMKKEFPRRPPTAENLYEYFISRARDNLHVVLCFSPVSQSFRTRALKFPGLFSGCTMDWFSRWPEDALIAVAEHFLTSFPMVCTPDEKKSVIHSMGTIHHIVGGTCTEYFERFRRTAHVTPKSYLSFLNGFRSVYTVKHKQLAELEERMNVGLKKLLEAGSSVEKLKLELVDKEKDLEVASAEADIVLAEVTKSSEAAQIVKAEVLKVKERAQNLVDTINREKSVAEQKLERAGPALLAAETALNTIKGSDIATVRKLGKPPHLIMRIMDCVLILFQKKLDTVTADPDKPYNKPSWSEALRLMASPGFLSELQHFNKDTITEEMVELLNDNYFSHEDYLYDRAKSVCGNVAGLLSWTTAMVSFYTVNKEVLPLKANLAKQAAKLQIANAELASAQAELDQKQAELDIVQAKFDGAMKMKRDLSEDAESCQRRAFAARALIDGLGGEKIRWTAQSKMFADQIRRLVGDVILATGFLSYCGPFNQEFRNSLMKHQWKDLLVDNHIPFTDNLDIIEMLTDSITIGEWNLQGLPTDDLSIQNGIIVTKASRYPLLIDPQGQAKYWINNKASGERPLLKTTLNNKYFRQHLEDALSLGQPLMIEDVGEELDPALDNVLERNFIRSGSTYKVKVGDKEVDVMDGFQLYITTKLPNPKYTPEVSARTSIIDFTVTAQGLEDQLLGRAVLWEKQELEAERVKLVTEVTANKRKMKELEDNLLYKLTSTKGSLVDDESLIVMLANTKETAAEVSEKLAVADDTNIKINLAREEYRPVAERGSILYFVICDMSMVNCMYQISLSQFLQLFDGGLTNSKRSPITSKRIVNINDHLTEIVFKYMCRGLYENDKFMFTLLMTLSIDMRKGYVKVQEFQTFIKGGAALDLKSSPAKAAAWILDMTWLNLCQLQKLPEFREILNQISRNEKQWKQWFDSEAPEEEPIPDGYSASLDTFRKLLLIRCWCPDRTMPQARLYIADSMGELYAEAVILDLDVLHEESDIHTPMIGLLSMGSDPTNQICEFAKKMSCECRCVSMGQGQEVHARRLISMSMQNGGWVLLQNCHLGLDFMDEMLNTLITCSDDQVNSSFRVWLTTEVHPQFSITTLQSSIKFTNEPPQGVKAGLKRTYSGYSQDILDISNLPYWKPLLYTVAFLHTTVQERRKFGPLGWNIPYEFNSADQIATVQFIQNHLDDLDVKRGIQWQTVRYMIGEVQYGGRVTDDFDKRLLNTFAKVWFSEDMFGEKFAFAKGYNIPKYVKLDDIMNLIEDMPLVDSPEVYGLHPNADITYQTNTSREILEVIVNIQPKDSGGGGGETREEFVYRSSDEMLGKLPEDYIAHIVKARLVKMGKSNSLNIFLGQEIDRMQKVIALVRSTLKDLKLAIDGTIIMSENLTDALDNIYDARVPMKWKKVSWASSTLGFWFTELLERCVQLSDWIFQGRPQVFWMTGFFNAQGFLTAMRQEVTRMHKGWALDSVVLHNEVTTKFKEDIAQAPAEGVYVHGLYLDGAGWDRKNCKLQESQLKVLFVPLPVVMIYAINSSSVNPSTLRKDMYECPVYKKPCRTDLTFITSLYLKCPFKDTFWTLRGVALLCDVK